MRRLKIKNLASGHTLIVMFVIVGCASVATNIDFADPLKHNLKSSNYAGAVQDIDKAREDNAYTRKDRVLYYLDKGTVLYFQGAYQESNEYLEKAELAMEELFTKSISKAAASMLLNDNALDYFGEFYENIYVNIFKALNYLKLSRFGDAYVEVRRVNIKLRELEDKYGEMVDQMNRSEKSEAKVEMKPVKFYNDALAHYISYLIFRAEGEVDNSRISLNKLCNAWEAHSDIYDHPIPDHIKQNNPPDQPLLNIIAFTGTAPAKKAVGGKITTYNDYVGVSDLDMPIALPNIPFPGVKAGYHFKFAFPVIESEASKIKRIDIKIDGQHGGSLQLLENMGRVAEKTFEMRKFIIYTKTVIRTVTKGLAAAEVKKKLRKETGASGLLGNLLDATVDVGVDFTENADLRCWRTMPQLCYVGEFPVQDGPHDIVVEFVDGRGLVVDKKEITGFDIHDGLNLIDAVSLN